MRLGFDGNSSATRPRYAHSTTTIGTASQRHVLGYCDLNDLSRTAVERPSYHRSRIVVVSLTIA